MISVSSQRSGEGDREAVEELWESHRRCDALKSPSVTARSAPRHLPIASRQGGDDVTFVSR